MSRFYNSPYSPLVPLAELVMFKLWLSKAFFQKTAEIIAEKLLELLRRYAACTRNVQMKTEFAFLNRIVPPFSSMICFTLFTPYPCPGECLRDTRSGFSVSSRSVTEFRISKR